MTLRTNYAQVIITSKQKKCINPAQLAIIKLHATKNEDEHHPQLILFHRLSSFLSLNEIQPLILQKQGKNATQFKNLYTQCYVYGLRDVDVLYHYPTSVYGCRPYKPIYFRIYSFIVIFSDNLRRSGIIFIQVPKSWLRAELDGQRSSNNVQGEFFFLQSTYLCFFVSCLSKL